MDPPRHGHATAPRRQSPRPRYAQGSTHANPLKWRPSGHGGGETSFREAHVHAKEPRRWRHSSTGSAVHSTRAAGHSVGAAPTSVMQRRSDAAPTPLMVQGVAAGQLVQLKDPAESAYDPAAHGAHSLVDNESANEPAGQFVHPVEEYPDSNLPAGHGVHATEPSPAAKVPGGHGKQPSTPAVTETLPNFPSGHRWQPTAWLVAAVVFP